MGANQGDLRHRQKPDRKRQLYAVVVGIAAAIILFGIYLITVSILFPRVLPQQAINLLPDAQMAQQGQKVLVFSPHPDDESIGVGGYIAESIQQGAEVRIVLITDGNRHHNEAVRYAEFKKATGILGVPESNLVFMGLPDGTLREMNQTSLYQLLQEQIDTYHPDIIIYPSTRDYHPDHYTAGRVINKILAASNNQITAFQYLVHYEFYYPAPKRLAPNLYLLPPVRLAGFGNNWQRVMLPQNIEDLKQKAIYSYQSQLSDPVLKELLLANIRKNELLLGR